MLKRVGLQLGFRTDPFIGAIVFLRVIGGIGVLCILVSIDEPQKKKGKAIHCISLS